MNGHGSGDAADEAPSEADMPSCQECRRRKLKCSRDQPTCAHCARLESPCVYDLKKNRPGLKPGAVGSLSRRVDALETAFEQLSQDRSRNPTHTDVPPVPASASQDLVTILSALASEVKELRSKPPPVFQPRPVDETRIPTVASPATSYASARDNSQRRDASTSPWAIGQPPKRRRMSSYGNISVNNAAHLEEEREDVLTNLPPSELLDVVIDTYFEAIQPWIPMLHEKQFRRQITDPVHRSRLGIVLHAMVVAAVRFIVSPSKRVSARDIDLYTKRSRKFVVLTSMDELSVEGLQALIIIAFDDVGNGEASRAWSIIGSMTRTVDYLQLSVEPENQQGGPLLKPLPTLDNPQNWTEEEQRRRVFWNVFCLDRFCSVTTGWNTSLTSSDVQRRLPADGGLWHKEEGVTTPYLGVWDRSTAKIGNSIAFLPANHLSPEQTKDHSSLSQAGSGAEKRNDDLDMTTVGAFAYRIEATESLSRITTYFLQQKVDFTNRQQVSDWLTRFKELDLRLVHWKMFLPQRWRDSNISRQPTLIRMDPNLTLAHVTHNTSMILLHQRIAYPDPSWSGSFKLPSFCSAEACQVSAVETTTITQKYHKHTAEYSPVTTQYAFCVFISARVLLIHHRYYKTDLAPEFWMLVGALDEMAKRWAGPVLQQRASQSLAGKYAAHLRSLHARCEANSDYTIDVLGYSSEMARESRAADTSSPFFPSHPGTTQEDSDRAQPQQSNGENGEHLLHAVSDARVNAPSGFIGTPQSVQDQRMQAQFLPNGDLHPDRLSSVSHMLMDEDFMAMDRVISLDDMIFAGSEHIGTGMTWATNGQNQFV